MLKELLDDICQELDIEYKIISNNYLICLKKNGKTKFIWGNKFDLNNHGLGIAFDDKYATYEVLKNIDVPVIEHSILYSSKNKSRYAKNKSGISYMKEIFNKYSKVDSSLSKLPFIPKEYLPKFKLIANITPSKEELEENNRARSSRLRVIERIED